MIRIPVLIVALALPGLPALAAPPDAPTVVAQRGRTKARRKPKPAPKPAEPPAEAPPAAPAAPAAEDPAATGLRRSNRVEFDARLVRGEKASGAVYLFHRAPRRLPALVKLEPDYLDPIVVPVLRRPAQPAPESAAPAAK